MSKYYKIVNREDSARIGTLNLNKKLFNTPLLIEYEMYNSIILDLGTFWLSENNLKDACFNKIKEIQKLNSNPLVILPRIQYSLSYPIESFIEKEQEIYNIFFSNNIIPFYPTAIIYKPDIKILNNYQSNEKKIKSSLLKKESITLCKQKSSILCDVYILESIGSLENDIYKFMNAIINTRKTIPFDVALWLPNIVTPINASLLVYLGADIFDTTKIFFDSLNDIYFTNNSIFNISELKVLPCCCFVCKSNTILNFQDKDPKKKFELLYNHNINILKQELLIIQEKIMNSDLRNYVESKCKLNTWLSGLLNLYDRSEYYNSKTGIYKKKGILSTSSDSIIRSEIQTFINRVYTRYQCPNKDILLILPCSSRKPYSFSKSHKRINNIIRKYKSYIHEIILTSPIGVVPQELELTYPASSYDSTVTGFWSSDEINFVSFALENYLLKNNYKYIIAHVSENYKKICENVSKNLNLNMIYTCVSTPSSIESLEYLNTKITNIISKKSEEKLNKLSNEQDKINIIKSIAKYQLGDISTNIFKEKTYVKGIYPKYQLYSDNNELLATIVPQSGLLSFSLKAISKIINSDKYNNQYTVYIDALFPTGSILSPVIMYADLNIKPGDEVIIKGKNIIGTGKAFMSGSEMCNSSKGQAIYIRNSSKVKTI